MKRNTELLEETMQYIMDHPEEHRQHYFWMDQRDSSCRTPGCFAGWAITLSNTKDQAFLADLADRYWHGDNGCASQQTIILACQLLGLTERESDMLFAGRNSREELQLMVKDLVNGERLKSYDHYHNE